MMIYSNDPTQRMKEVKLSGLVYEPNALSLSGEPSADYDAYTLSVALDNYSPITAVQFDLTWIEGMSASSADVQLSARCSNHSLSLTPTGKGAWRVILYSLSNAPIADASGALFDLTFRGINFTGTTISASNILLGATDGKDYTSPGATLVTTPVTAVKAQSITLNAETLELKPRRQSTLTATLLPLNTYNKAYAWSSSNEAVATVSPEGVVTAVYDGVAIITATALDGSGVKAACRVTVVPPTPGDVDDNDRVTLDDAFVLARYISGVTDELVEPRAADLNGDGRVTVADVVAIVAKTLSRIE
jgi:hypothetical protein